jgi:hypothetical protein
MGVSIWVEMTAKFTIAIENFTKQLQTKNPSITPVKNGAGINEMRRHFKDVFIPIHAEAEVVFAKGGNKMDVHKLSSVCALCVLKASPFLGAYDRMGIPYAINYMNETVAFMLAQELMLDCRVGKYGYADPVRIQNIKDLINISTFPPVVSDKQTPLQRLRLILRDNKITRQYPLFGRWLSSSIRLIRVNGKFLTGILQISIFQTSFAITKNSLARKKYTI